MIIHVHGRYHDRDYRVHARCHGGHYHDDCHDEYHGEPYDDEIYWLIRCAVNVLSVTTFHYDGNSDDYLAHLCLSTCH